MLFLPISLVRLGNSITSPNSEICRKLKTFSRFIVNKVVQGNRIKASPLPSYLADVITRISKGFNSIHKLLEFIFSYIEFADHSFDNFHQSSYMLSKFKNLTEVRSPLSPHPYGWSLQRAREKKSEKG